MHRSYSSVVKPPLLAISAISALWIAGSAVGAPPAATLDNAPSEKPAKKSPENSEQPKRVMQSADGSVVLSGRAATIHGDRLRYEPQKRTLGYWFNADDWVSWDFEVTRPGKLFVDLRQSCGPDSAGSHYTVEVGEQKFKDKVQDTGSFGHFRVRRLGTLQFEKTGIYTLSLRVQDKPQSAVMDLRDITLMPVELESPKAPPTTDKKAAPKQPATPPSGQRDGKSTLSP